MARHPVTELMIQHNGSHSVVRVSGSESPSKISEQHNRAAITCAGISVAVVGTGLWIAGMSGPGIVMLLMSAVALTVTGLQAWVRDHDVEDSAAPALPPAETSPTVKNERARRVMNCLGMTGACTFEALMSQLRWTESALVETLVYMKENGWIEEDLDFESGQWIYRSAASDAPISSMSLEDRRRRAGV